MYRWSPFTQYWVGAWPPRSSLVPVMVYIPAPCMLDDSGTEQLQSPLVAIEQVNGSPCCVVSLKSEHCAVTPFCMRHEAGTCRMLWPISVKSAVKLPSLNDHMPLVS